MFKIHLLLSLVFLLSSCSTFSEIWGNPSARFIATTKTYDTVKVTLDSLIKSRIIKSESDLRKIELAVEQGDKNMILWRDALADKKAGNKYETLFKAALDTLSAVEKEFSSPKKEPDEETHNNPTKETINHERRHGKIVRVCQPSGGVYTKTVFIPTRGAPGFTNSRNIYYVSGPDKSRRLSDDRRSQSGKLRVVRNHGQPYGHYSKRPSLKRA